MDQRDRRGVDALRARYPVVLVGDLGGYLRQGQYLHYANRTQGDLMLTLAGAVSAAPFGDPAIAVSPLQELLAP